MYSTPRTLVSGRIPEYLDNLKAEFESLAHDVNMYKMQRDDYERKLQSQLAELGNIQQTLYDLDRNHQKIKQQYEEEILRLRRQIDVQSGNGVSPSTFAVSGSSVNTSVPVSNTLPAVRTSEIRTPTSTNVDKSILNSPPAASTSSMFYTGLAPLDIKSRVTTPTQGSPAALSSSAAASTATQFPTAITSSAPSMSASAILTPTQPTTPTTTAASNTLKRPREDFASYATTASAVSEKSFMLNQLSGDPTPVKQHKPDVLSPVMHTTPTTSVTNDDKSKTTNAASKEDKEGILGVDWIVGYNPGVQTNLNIDLVHNLEHSSVVCCVKFGNDGKSIATGCNKSAQIYDVDTGEKIHTFSEDLGKEGDLYIRSVCFSPDNKFLAAGAEDKTVKLWDIEKKRLHHTFIGHELDIYSLDFSNDGKFIVSGSGDKKAKIWDVEKGECLFTLGNDEVGPKDGVTSVAWSPDGRLVAAGSLDRIVRLWDAQSGYFLERYEGHLDSVYSVAFSPDGKSLASGSLDKTLKLWDLSGSRSRSRCRSTFTGHKDFVLSVAFSPDGNWLISGSKDRSVQFWDPRSAVTHMMLQGHKNSVINVAVSPLGGVFATGSGDFRARVWKYE